jgi:hypothetical protein
MKYKLITAFSLLIAPQQCMASWLDVSGKVTNIITYAHTETILVNLDVSGANVVECSNSRTFAISSTISAEGRSRMYAMLLSAQATGRSITVSYNSAGGCEAWGATPNTYRRIVRLR